MNIEKVSFISDGLRIAGQIFYPEHYSANKKYPALLFEGPMTGLKDQVVEIYAKKLANLGYLTLTFDHRYYGESEGEPRQLEAPAKKVEDLQNAVSYLLTREDVDADRLGAVGICAGGGFMSKTAALDQRIKSLVTVAGFYHDPKVVRAWLGEEGYQHKIELSKQAQEKYEQTGEVVYIPSVSSDSNETEVAMPGDEPYAYYGTDRGVSPHYINRFAVMSFEEFLHLNSLDFAGQIHWLFMVHKICIAPLKVLNNFSIIYPPPKPSSGLKPRTISIYMIKISM
ncbi:alpha/beta fold hydrolase [Shimazuella sp. AN120528]|uniref:alpha/beta hydrolase n=1 Tax=Shimazuella soli TaxID=1892854 RepID=UPI001F0D374B|nr:alpha/beta fold hydrolase [Shimazuella soli]MCH5586408.1 alpha/beta fold hydrolase [Shimazuella soli]